jgi:hypothetical protein
MSTKTPTPGAQNAPQPPNPSPIMDANEIPDWVEYTPEDTDYSLSMCPPSGSV